MATKMVEISAKIPEEEYNQFIEIFSDGTDRARAMYGASTWFIRNAMHNFLQELDGNPTLQEACRNSIKSMVENNRE